MELIHPDVEDLHVHDNGQADWVTKYLQLVE
jgi:hypothetical protein